jgi:sortase A
MKSPNKLESALLVLGLSLLSFSVGGMIRGTMLSHAEVERFESRQTQLPGFRQPVAVLRADSTAPASPDFEGWSRRRRQAYQESLAIEYPPALAVLRITKIQLAVPVLEGTDELTLNRGVGRIRNTAYPGDQDGNIGIAGHRDGFFRGLKDIGRGDQIQMVLEDGTETYIVDQILIVPPTDVSVLQPRAAPSLTLVTCYPFHFVGSAPERYIVQATKADFEYGSVYIGQAGIKTISETRQQENKR